MCIYKELARYIKELYILQFKETCYACLMERYFLTLSSSQLASYLSFTFLGEFHRNCVTTTPLLGNFNAKNHEIPHYFLFGSAWKFYSFLNQPLEFLATCFFSYHLLWKFHALAPPVWVFLEQTQPFLIVNVTFRKCWLPN